jgi:hypothetical protein
VTRAALALAVLIAGGPAFAADPPDAPKPAARKRARTSVKGTVKEAARTGGHAARDGALTFGRSAGAFFTEGPSGAKRTWKANAAKTKRNAKQGAAATKAAAGH